MKFCSITFSPVIVSVGINFFILLNEKVFADPLGAKTVTHVSNGVFSLELTFFLFIYRYHIHT